VTIVTRVLKNSYASNFMSKALDCALTAFNNDEVPVGAIVVLNGEIIGQGSNNSISSSNVFGHAEINAINDATKRLGNYRLNGASLFSTLEPCHMCAMAMVHARIKNLYFGAKEPKTGAVVSVDNFLDKDFLNHKVNYSGGHMERESSALLRDFFATKRKI
jgi:tRNA(adenine34) deaminase